MRIGLRARYIQLSRLRRSEFAPCSGFCTPNAGEILIDGVAAANVSDGIVRLSVYAKRYDPAKQTSRPTIVANLVMGRNAMQQLQNAMQQLLADRLTRSSDAKPPAQQQ